MDLLCKLVPSAEKEGGRSKKSKHSVGVINGWSLSVGRRERECAPIRMPYMRALHAAIFFFLSSMHFHTRQLSPPFAQRHRMNFKVDATDEH